MPGGAPVCTGGTSPGLHGLQCEGVVEGDIIDALDFGGPPCPPVGQRRICFGAVQGIVDGCSLQVGVNGNVGVRCRAYPDSLCGSLGCFVVVSQGCACNGRLVPGGYENVPGLCWLYLVCREEVHDFDRCYSREDLSPIDVARR